MSASSFSRLCISQRHIQRQANNQHAVSPQSQTKPSNLNQLEVPLSLVTEAHSEALPWKLETSSVLFIREDLAQKYFMISMALDTYSSQHNEVKLVTPELCEDTSGVFFNQAARTSLHLQWAITCSKWQGKAEQHWEKQSGVWGIKLSSQRVEREKTSSQPFPKADYILPLSLPRGYKWCCYWLFRKAGFLPGRDISHLTHVTATAYLEGYIKYSSLTSNQPLQPGTMQSVRASTPVHTGSSHLNRPQRQNKETAFKTMLLA